MATQELQEALQVWEDSAVDQVLCGEQSLPGVVSKSSRKQHRSCDQCRKGKKGCDAVILKDFGNDLADNNVESSLRRVSEIIQERFPSVHARIAQRPVKTVPSYGYSHKRETVVDGQKMGWEQLTQEDRKTMDLLYWLGVMFDTLSAAIHKRPLVVSDEDSDIYPQDPPNLGGLRERGLGREDRQNPMTEQHTPGRLMPASTSKLWSVFFFQDQALRNSTPPIRWPCSYQSAATALADAAPIKVLLFRRVTRIQTLMLRHVHGEQLEEAVTDALKVYQYWNRLYRPFILDCVAHHDQLPARIQSWYICLTGHWHLAVLLLADIIQAIDTDGQMGLESHRRWRESCGLVTTLRQHTSHAVANLARCSCPRENASFPDAGEFHCAVNQGALLTEPWTQVLIRVFAKAGALLLADAAISEYRIDPGKSCNQALEHSESCVVALWYLGRKSDMAFLAGKVLAKALKDTRQKMVTAEMSHISEDWLEPMASVDRDFSFPGLPAQTDGFAHASGDAEFGLLEEDTMQNYRVGVMGVDGFESFI